jgi:hypothetical protein
MKLLLFAALALPTTLMAETPAVPEKAAPKKEVHLTPGGIWPEHSMDRPRPRVVTPPTFSSQEAAGQPPTDAKVLFGGTDLSGWKLDKKSADGATDAPAGWKVANGYLEVVPKSGSIRTREKFKGESQWHLEWATPSEVKGNSQGRGNSGVFIEGFPEIQVLDSFENDTYPDGQAAGLYGFYPPMVNASRKPGEWQTYDVVVEAPREGRKGRLTVIHNGIVVQWGREFDLKNNEFSLGLQDHGNPVRYRNIWVRALNFADPDSEGTPPPPKASPGNKK